MSGGIPFVEQKEQHDPLCCIGGIIVQRSSFVLPLDKYAVVNVGTPGDLFLRDGVACASSLRCSSANRRFAPPCWCCAEGASDSLMFRALRQVKLNRFREECEEPVQIDPVYYESPNWTRRASWYSLNVAGVGGLLPFFN